MPAAEARAVDPFIAAVICPRVRCPGCLGEARQASQPASPQKEQLAARAKREKFG